MPPEPLVRKLRSRAASAWGNREKRGDSEMGLETCKENVLRTVAASPPVASSSATRASSWLWDRLPTTPVGTEDASVPTCLTAAQPLSTTQPRTSCGQVSGVHNPGVHQQHVQELKHRVRLWRICKVVDAGEADVAGTRLAEPRQH